MAVESDDDPMEVDDEEEEEHKSQIKQTSTTKRKNRSKALQINEEEDGDDTLLINYASSHLPDTSACGQQERERAAATRSSKRSKPSTVLEPSNKIAKTVAADDVGVTATRKGRTKADVELGENQVLIHWYDWSQDNKYNQDLELGSKDRWNQEALKLKELDEWKEAVKSWQKNGFHRLPVRLFKRWENVRFILDKQAPPSVQDLDLCVLHTDELLSKDCTIRKNYWKLIAEHFTEISVRPSNVLIGDDDMADEDADAIGEESDGSYEGDD